LLQLELSKVLESISNLKAANVSLQQTININKTVVPSDLQTFFILMEVYGSMVPQSIIEGPEISTLEAQRINAKNKLDACVHLIKESQARMIACCKKD
jgi:hypothetical protein